jgi:hypothetical protein
MEVSEPARAEAEESALAEPPRDLRLKSNRGV